MRLAQAGASLRLDGRRYGTSDLVMIARSLHRDALLTLANSEGKQTSSWFRSSMRRRGKSRSRRRAKQTDFGCPFLHVANHAVMVGSASARIYAPQQWRATFPAPVRAGAGFFRLGLGSRACFNGWL